MVWSFIFRSRENTADATGKDWHAVISHTAMYKTQNGTPEMQVALEDCLIKEGEHSCSSDEVSFVSEWVECDNIEDDGKEGCMWKLKCKQDF